MADIDIIKAGLVASIVDALTNSVDAGSANPQGKCRVVDGVGTVLVDIDLNNPAFVAGVGDANDLDLTGTLSGVASNTGTAAKCQLLDRDDVVVFEGSATLVGGGGFAELDKTSITSGDTVTIVSMTVSHPG